MTRSLPRAGLALLAGAVALSACASVPQGPTVAVMPSPNKPFEVFRSDDFECRQYAEAQVSGQVADANNRALRTAVLTAALATAAGAAIGAAGDGDVYRTRRGIYRQDSASAGEGAAVGAALGALGGAAIGAGSSSEEQDPIQRRYNIAYSQCMYSRGNQVPGYRDEVRRTPPPPPPEY